MFFPKNQQWEASDKSELMDLLMYVSMVTI